MKVPVDGRGLSAEKYSSTQCCSEIQSNHLRKHLGRLSMRRESTISVETYEIHGLKSLPTMA